MSLTPNLCENISESHHLDQDSALQQQCVGVALHFRSIGVIIVRSKQ
jgi:hypothetical protein